MWLKRIGRLLLVLLKVVPTLIILILATLLYVIVLGMRWVWTKQYTAWWSYRQQKSKRGQRVTQWRTLRHNCQTNLLYLILKLFEFLYDMSLLTLKLLLGKAFKKRIEAIQSRNPSTIN